MTENKKTVRFRLGMANMIATLKILNENGLLSHAEHFDLWRKLLKIETQKELDGFCRAVRDLVKK